MEQAVPVVTMKQLIEVFGKQGEPLGTKVLLVEDLSGELYFSDRSFQIDAFAIALLTAGSSELSIETYLYHSHPNSMILYTPRSMVQIRKHEGVNMRLLVFDREIFSSFSQSLELITLIARIRRQNMIVQPKENQLVLMHTLFDSCKQMIVLKSPNAEEMLANIIYSLFLTIEDVLISSASEQDMHPKIKRSHEIASNFVLLLSKHCKREHTVKFYAQKLCLNPKYFSAAIKKLTGHTAAEIIDIFVIMEIKKQLQYSNLSLQQIGLDFNFKSQSFFGRYFKKHVGMSPSEYRAQSR